MSRDLEDRIAGWAARQHGVVTRSQLFETGLSRGAISRRVEAGRLRLLFRGVYRVGPVELPLTREMAAVLVCGPGAVLSHAGAGRLWGVLGPTGGGGRDRQESGHRQAGSPPDVGIDVTIDGSNRGRRSGIRVHRAHLEPVERTIRSGIPVTSPARTLLDLASAVGLRELESAVARAEREELVTRTDLEVYLGGRSGRLGARALRAVLELEGGPALTRSEAEARFLDLVRDAGLPCPATNVGLGPYEIDFLWHDAGIAVEIDGFRYHRSRPRFEGDRRKDAWLAAHGITVLRISWRQLDRHPVATAVQIGQSLARSGRPV